jgi:hypothetical protein
MIKIPGEIFTIGVCYHVHTKTLLVSGILFVSDMNTFCSVALLVEE